MSKELAVRDTAELSLLLTEGPWTRFMDMHSGGGQKLSHAYILIQATAEDARNVFYAKFGRNADHVTCDCCGNDYSVSQDVDLYQATGYDRGCAFVDGKYIEESVGPYYRYRSYRTLTEYLASNEALLVLKGDITDLMRQAFPTDDYAEFEEIDD